MRKIKYKKNKDGISTTFCPNGFTTFVGNRKKRVGDDCLFCKYRKHIDYDAGIVECLYHGKKSKSENKRNGEN